MSNKAKEEITFMGHTSAQLQLGTIISGDPRVMIPEIHCKSGYIIKSRSLITGAVSQGQKAYKNKGDADKSVEYYNKEWIGKVMHWTIEASPNTPWINTSG